MKKEPECYGKMFPSMLHVVHNQSVKGKVFGYAVDYPGGVATKSVIVNDEAWQDCVNCPELDVCYRLSSGTALIELAIRSLPDTLY